MNYTKPGRYAVICNNTSFDGHHVKVFDFPDTPTRSNEGKVDAAWWFLNKIDVTASIDAVYPLEIFAPLLKEMVPGVINVEPLSNEEWDKAVADAENETENRWRHLEER